RAWARPRRHVAAHLLTREGLDGGAGADHRCPFVVSGLKGHRRYRLIPLVRGELVAAALRFSNGVGKELAHEAIQHDGGPGLMTIEHVEQAPETKPGSILTNAEGTEVNRVDGPMGNRPIR